jgi:hypothetical protein
MAQSQSSKGMAWTRGARAAAVIAYGDVHMGWNFGKRSGILKISNFQDKGKILPELNAWGRMKMPAVLDNPNQFAGRLVGKLNYDEFSARVRGAASGSFVASGANKAAAAIGNWNVANKFYQASGIFGASQTHYSLSPGLNRD